MQIKDPKQEFLADIKKSVERKQKKAQPPQAVPKKVKTNTKGPQ